MIRTVLFKRRRGVSALVGVLLLVGMAVMLSAALFGWSSGFLSGVGTAAAGQQPLQNEATQALLKIEYVQAQGVTSGTTFCSVTCNAYLYVYVRNVGTYAPLTVGSITISGFSTNVGFKKSVLPSWSGSAWSSISPVLLCSTSGTPNNCASLTTVISLQRLGTGGIIVVWPQASCTSGGCPVSGDTISITVSTSQGATDATTVVVP